MNIQLDTLPKYSFMGINARVLADADAITEAEWLEYRKVGIGGSDVGTIVGANKWCGPIRLNGEAIGLLEKKEVGEAAQWGHILEPAVANEWSKRTGISIKKVRKMLIGSGDPKAHQVINLDYICKDPRFEAWGVLEIKTTTAYNAAAWGTDEDPIVPASYWWQVQHYMDGTGLEYAWVVCLIGGQKLVERFVPRDKEAYDKVVPYLDAFYRASVVEKRPLLPGEIYRAGAEGSADDSAASADIAAEKGLMEEGSAGTLEDLGLVKPYQEYVGLKEQIKGLEQKQDQLKAILAGHLVANRIVKATFSGRSAVSLRITNRTNLDKKAVAAAGIDLTPYETTSQSKAWYIL